MLLARGNVESQKRLGLGRACEAVAGAMTTFPEDQEIQEQVKVWAGLFVIPSCRHVLSRVYNNYYYYVTITLKLLRAVVHCYVSQKIS